MPVHVLNSEMLSQATQAILSALAILAFAAIVHRLAGPAAAR